MKFRYILLALSLTLLAIGFSDAGTGVLFELGRPVGSILFGLFMVCTVLEKASADYLEEEKTKTQALRDRNCNACKKVLKYDEIHSRNLGHQHAT